MAGRSRRSRFSGFSTDSDAFLKHTLGQPGRVSSLASNGVPSSGNTQSQNVKRKTYSVSQAVSRPSGVAFGRQTGTSSYNRPSVSSRPSTGRPSAGRSSVYGSHAQVKKDPRQLSDKAYQLEMIRKLKKFLEESGYPKTNLSVKQLQTPTTKEFLHIFNFLLEKIDDSLPINGMNLIEEVPAALKLLGYPFTVSKNHLMNVGSPHSWPHMLGAITWLIDCCQLPDNKISLMFGGGGDGFDDDGDDEREYELEELMYQTYMKHGGDSSEYQGMMGELRGAVEKQCEELEEDCSKIKEDNAKLEEAHVELSKSSLPVLQAEVQQNQAAIEELTQQLESQVIPAMQEEKRATAEIDSHASEVEMQIMASTQKIQELEEQIRHQPMSAKDAHELHQSIGDAKDVLEMKRNQEEASCRRISELQMQHNRSVQRINTVCQEINGGLNRLAAVLPDAASLPTLDYEVNRKADPSVLKKLVEQAKFIRDQIEDLHRGVSNGITEYEGQLISVESAQSALRTESVRKDLEVDNMQQSLNNARETLSRKRKLAEECMKTELTEKQALEKALRGLEQRLDTKSAAENDLALIKQKSEMEMADMAARLDRENKDYQELLISLTKFVEIVKTQQDTMKGEFSEVLKEFRELKFPAVPPRFLAPFDPNNDTYS